MKKTQYFLLTSILYLLFLWAFPAQAQADNDPDLDSMLTLLKTAKEDSLRIAILMNISRVSARSNINLSVEYAQQAVNEAGESESKQILALALDNAARICFMHGLLDIPADYLTRYIALMEEAGNKEELQKARANIGSLWLVMERYEQAEQAYMNWLEEQEGKGSSVKVEDMVAIYSNMGILKTSQGKFEEAADYFEKGIALHGSDTLHIMNLVRLLTNYGDLLVKKQDYDQAFEKLTRVLDISRQQKDKLSETAVLMSLGKAYEAAGEQKQAINSYSKSFVLACETGSISNMESSAFYLYKVYEKSGSADSVLKYMSIFNEYREKRNAGEAREKLIREELTAGFREREKAQLERQKVDRWLMLLLTLLLCSMLAVAVWLFFSTRKRLVQSSLSKMNLELDARRLELEKELLTAEVEQKNKELAAKVVYDIQKNELIGNVVDKLLEQKKTKQAGNQNDIGQIIQALEKTREEHVWEDFEIRFKQVHHSFYEKLQQINPDLTPNERRLCAFLKMNMSTKEISTITGQTPHSIKIARTRLRKKLNLTNTEQGLVEFLAAIG